MAYITDTEPPSLRYKIITGALWLAFGLLAIFFLFFIMFAEGRRQDAMRTSRAIQADGIVVLTGSAKARIAEGLQLMAEKRGRRLLITGVHKNLSMDDILRLGQVAPEKIRCCVDLDYRANDTVGNAAETALWARIQGYRSLILVTSTHHIPRTLIEMNRVMPNIRLIAYPVNPEGIKLQQWWKYPGTFILLLGEFTRYLFALFHLTGDYRIPTE